MEYARLYYGGSQYGLYAYGTVGFEELEKFGAVNISGKATLSAQGIVLTNASIDIVGRANVLAQGYRGTFGAVSIVGKARLTSTITYVAVIPTIDIFFRNEEVVVSSIGKRIDISITDITEDKIKPTILVKRSQPEIDVITHTTQVIPHHRGAEISYKIERSEEFIYAD